MRKQIEISDKTKRAICAVAGECLYDMDPKGARSRRVMAEVALDADRLRSFGFPEAQEEMRRLFDEFGYEAVEKVVRKFVPTA